MNNRMLLGGLIGGVAFFILGYLVYGMALASMMEENMMAGINRPMDQFQWLFLILGNLAYGFLLSYVLTKSNTSGLGGGATVGAVLGLLVGLAFSFTMYGVSNIYTTLTGVFVDIVGTIVVWAVAGGIVGAFLGMGNKSAARI